MSNARLTFLLAACSYLPAGAALAQVQTPQRVAELFPPTRAGVLERIDFESLAPGTIVGMVTGNLGTGPILVDAMNPALGAVNAAVVFDSSAPTGEDPDLGTPNVDFGGPGVGSGGSAGAPYQNDRPLGHVLIVGEDLVDADNDGLVDDPDDATLMMEPIEFDFGSARVRMESIAIVDVEARRLSATVEMFAADGTSLAMVVLPQVGDNGLATVPLGGVSGVARVLVILNGSGAIDDLAFVRECTGSIGDFVWHDLNRDGIQNAGEPGLQGVDVLLLDAGGQIIQVATTGASGGYLFGGLCAGAYTVVVDPSTLPPGFVPSPCNVGPNEALDNDCSPVAVVLATDDTYEPRIDFGYQSVMDGEIGDFVWHDVDQDGLQDAGEPGIEGVELTLYQRGVPIATTTTDRSGLYLFRGLASGSYTVEVDPDTLPGGFAPTACNAGGDDTVDNDCSPAPAFLPTSSSSDRTVDFGYASPCTGCIGDLVWHDLDRNGIQDAGEPGLEGVTVLLLDGNGDQIAVSTTGPGGSYAFGGLCAGTYTVAVQTATLPPGFVPSPCDNGGDDELDNDCSPLTVVLGDDTTCGGSYDFGYRGTGIGQIGDFVWFDQDCDGIQDVFIEGILAEPGIGGVTILLRDDMGVILSSQTTNEEGSYTFSGLSDGTYIVEVDMTTVPDGLEATTCNAGDDGSADNDCSPVIVTLGNNPSFTLELTIDFGFRTTGCTGQGCTPGYWKQEHHHDSWPAGYDPFMLFRDIFDDAFRGMTLNAVLSQGGGGLLALGRHTVAALLNAASPDVVFELTPEEVVQMFNDVYPGTEDDYEMLKDFFADLNERDCPLN